MNIILYSPIKLENWDHTTPDTTGIGGSETCHVKLAYHFASRNYDVISLAPVDRCYLGPGQAYWEPLDSVDNYLSRNQRQIWLVFRDPTFFDKIEKRKKTQRYYFIAQDVDYDWTDERLAKVDKYICLCKTHAEYTLNKYPGLKDKVYISTNGIDSIVLKQKYNHFKKQKQPKRVIYTSSPDRGLELILENWFRVEERHPDVKLDIYYGFNNLLKLAQGNDWRKQLHDKIIHLASQYKTVEIHGRIPQPQLHEEMAKSSVWFYPGSWPETSCITVMEIQALGVYPIVRNYWAQGENCFNGTKLDGDPKNNILDRCIAFKELNNILSVDTSEEMNKIRDILSEDACDSFGWDKVAEQYVKWFNEEDFTNER